LARIIGLDSRGATSGRVAACGAVLAPGAASFAARAALAGPAATAVGVIAAASNVASAATAINLYLIVGISCSLRPAWLPTPLKKSAGDRFAYADQRISPVSPGAPVRPVTAKPGAGTLAAMPNADRDAP
jgi:hypothetical protein